MHCVDIEMLSFCYLWCLWNWENMRFNRIQRVTTWLNGMSRFHFMMSVFLHFQLEFESLFLQHDPEAQFQYLRCFRRARVLFSSVEKAEKAHKSLDSSEILGQPFHCYFAQVVFCSSLSLIWHLFFFLEHRELSLPSNAFGVCVSRCVYCHCICHCNLLLLRLMFSFFFCYLVIRWFQYLFGCDLRIFQFSFWSVFVCDNFCNKWNPFMFLLMFSFYFV